VSCISEEGIWPTRVETGQDEKERQDSGRATDPTGRPEKGSDLRFIRSIQSIKKNQSISHSMTNARASTDCGRVGHRKYKSPGGPFSLALLPFFFLFACFLSIQFSFFSFFRALASCLVSLYSLIPALFLQQPAPLSSLSLQASLTTLFSFAHSIFN